MTSPPTLTYRDYTVGWICALPTEMAAAAATAVSYAKELLHTIPGNQVTGARTAAETTSDMGELSS